MSNTTLPYFYVILSSYHTNASYMQFGAQGESRVSGWLLNVLSNFGQKRFILGIQRDMVVD